MAPRLFPCDYQLTRKDRDYAEKIAKWDEQRMDLEVLRCAAWCKNHNYLIRDEPSTWIWWVDKGAQFDADRIAKQSKADERERRSQAGYRSPTSSGVL
jgi:hypothetical protein